MEFKVDGRAYNVSVTSLQRSFEVADSDSSGRTADWRMHRDVVGTFYNYSISIDTFRLNTNTYHELYDLLSAPMVSHRFEMPYGRDVLRFEGYVTKGTDNLKFERNGVQYWGGLSFNVISMEPQRRN